MLTFHRSRAFSDDWTSLRRNPERSSIYTLLKREQRDFRKWSGKESFNGVDMAARERQEFSLSERSSHPRMYIMSTISGGLCRKTRRSFSEMSPRFLFTRRDKRRPGNLQRRRYPLSTSVLEFHCKIVFVFIFHTFQDIV